ncbi:uncharacterized protein LOC132734817 [Ruditapes philippinarum]|uniref:uncharacterized protein LOC132734817 n=1 Tax=Ruditapes philippinarum TaxID=129788 RepID=UPI00295BC12D|nr:uncharacterized protein LOC132734817 [Ruditapes philippinarum]
MDKTAFLIGCSLYRSEVIFVRNNVNGPKPYYTANYIGNGVAGIHEHASNSRTVGMGELNFVLNGVEFRTRHNDYRLRMPVKNDTTYNKVVDIPYPDVPPQVLAKKTIAEQITEMQEWFKGYCVLLLLFYFFNLYILSCKFFPVKCMLFEFRMYNGIAFDSSCIEDKKLYESK